MAVRIDIKQLKSVARELKSKEGIGSNKGDKGKEYIGSVHWTMEMSLEFCSCYLALKINKAQILWFMTGEPYIIHIFNTSWLIWQ